MKTLDLIGEPLTTEVDTITEQQHVTEQHVNTLDVVEEMTTLGPAFEIWEQAQRDTEEK